MGIDLHTAKFLLAARTHWGVGFRSTATSATNIFASLPMRWAGCWASLACLRHKRWGNSKQRATISLIRSFGTWGAGDRVAGCFRMREPPLEVRRNRQVHFMDDGCRGSDWLKVETRLEKCRCNEPANAA